MVLQLSYTYYFQMSNASYINIELCLIIHYMTGFFQYKIKTISQFNIYCILFSSKNEIYLKKLKMLYRIYESYFWDSKHVPVLRNLGWNCIAISTYLSLEQPIYLYLQKSMDATCIISDSFVGLFRCIYRYVLFVSRSMVPVCNVAGVQLIIMQCVHQERDIAWRYLLNELPYMIIMSSFFFSLC